MSVIALDFYEPDGTTLIGTLDDADLLDLELRPALMELGAISFTINRHDATSALLTKRNLIKVRVPSVDADPIALFVLKDDEAELVSKDEEGGEHLKYTGPGGLHMLSYGRLDEVFYAPGQTRRGNQEIPGEWAWHDVAYGGILARIMEEGIYSPGGPLAAISIDFSRTADSDGNPWYVIAEDFSVATGTDVLTTATRLAEAGDLIMILTPDMILHCYQSVSDFARNLTGAFAADNVRIEKGVNLLTELNRKAKIDRITHLITRDMDQVFRTFVTPDAYEQAVYGFMDIDWTNDPDQIEKTADYAIASSANYVEEFRVEFTPGFAPADGLYMPGPDGTDGHFWLADQITLHTGTGEHDLNAAAVFVAGMVIALDEAADDATDDKAARSLRIVPELTVGLPPPAFSNIGSGTTRTGGIAGPTIRPCRPMSGTAPESVGGASAFNFGAQFVVPSGLVNGAIFVCFAWRSDGPDITAPFYDPDPGDPGPTYPLTKVTGSEVEHSAGGITPQHEWWYLLDPVPSSDPGGGSVDPGGVSSNPIAHLLRGVDPANPWSGFVSNDGVGAASSLAALVAGANQLAIDAVHTWTNNSNPTAAPVPSNALVTAGFSDQGNPGSADQEIGGSYGDAPTWTFNGTNSPIWLASGLRINGIAGTVGDGHLDLVGTSIRYTRCDHRHDVHRDHEPTTSDNAAAGYANPGIIWAVLDDLDTPTEIVSIWVLVDPDAGTWLEWSSGVTDHGALTGLADNDHPQYLLVTDAPTTAGDLTTRWIPLTVYDPGVGNYLPLVDGSGNQLMAEGS